MTFAGFYKYSWFSNMAYVLWNNENTETKQRTIDVASDPAVARIPSLLGAPHLDPASHFSLVR